MLRTGCVSGTSFHGINCAAQWKKMALGFEDLRMFAWPLIVSFGGDFGPDLPSRLSL